MRGRASASICQVLRKDPELADRVPPAERPQAIKQRIARVGRIPRGDWTQQRAVALLDEPAARRLARYPELTGRLVGRALERSRNLAVNMAIVHHARVEVRLHMLFWHLADRWGRVRSDGIVMRLPLTHSVLGDLVAARRPTVTSALSELAKRGLVRLVDRTWLLSGEPPGELLELQPVTVAQSEQNPRALADLR